MMDARKKGLDVKAAEDQYLCFGLRGKFTLYFFY